MWKNGANRLLSYVTHILRFDSKIPSNFKDLYLFCFFLSLSNNFIAFSCSFKKDSLIFFLVSSSFIIIKFHGCEYPTEGA